MFDKIHWELLQFDVFVIQYKKKTSEPFFFWFIHCRSKMFEVWLFVDISVHIMNAYLRFCCATQCVMRICFHSMDRKPLTIYLYVHTLYIVVVMLMMLPLLLLLISDAMR